MSSKIIDGVLIKSYSAKKDYSKRRDQGFVLIALALITLAFIGLGELGGRTNALIENTGTFISNHN